MARGVARLELPTWITFAPCRTITGYLRSLACAHIIMPKNRLKKAFKRLSVNGRLGEIKIALMDTRGLGDRKPVLSE